MAMQPAAAFEATSQIAASPSSRRRTVEKRSGSPHPRKDASVATCPLCAESLDGADVIDIPGLDAPAHEGCLDRELKALYPA